MAKPNISVMLGVAKGKPSGGPPPSYGGGSPAATAPPTDPMEGAENEGACSITCPKCGEMLNLTVQPQVSEESAESGMSAPDQMVS
jgi:hypothetical protein